jgi:branched-chain amino acid transport system substrate-binding protein
LRTIAGIASASALLSLLSACGSSSKPSTSSATTAATSAGSTASTASGSPATTTGSAAATKSPLTIGLADDDTGLMGFPAWQASAITGEKWVNAHGGINGHPLNLVTCDMMSTESGAQTCGTQFADDQNMPATIDLSSGGAPFYNAIGPTHKPGLGVFLTLGAVDNNPPDTYEYYPSNNYALAVIDYIKSLPNFSSIKNMAFLYISGFTDSLDQEEQMAAALPTVKIHVQALSPTAADITSNLVAADVATDDIVYYTASIPCSVLAQDAKSLGIQLKLVIINSPSCVTPQALDSDPGLYTGWVALDTTKDAAADPTDPESATFLAAWKQYNPPGATYTELSEWAFGAVLTLQKVLQGLPDSDLTSAGINTALASYKGPVVMGAPHISCPGPAPDIAACSTGVIPYQFQANGQIKLLPNGA